jgi:glycosyltransferase involved in cell wall biosynthesis
MKIRALSLVKNEGDIIAHNLRAACEWCDAIYVFDNGSSDATWDIVRKLAGELPAIVPFKQDPKPFSDSLRQEIFARFRSGAQPGDWWCVLDADEFYVDDPRLFLSRVPDMYRSVWPQLYTYLFTEADAAQPADAPAPERLHHYVLGEYSEPRFIRYAKGMTSFPPRELHPIYPERIRMRHYPYRSPGQIELRLRTRRPAMTRGEFAHELRSNWATAAIASKLDPEALPERWEERLATCDECWLDRGPETLLPVLPWSSPGFPSYAPARSKSFAAQVKGFLFGN